MDRENDTVSRLSEGESDMAAMQREVEYRRKELEVDARLNYYTRYSDRTWIAAKWQ